MKHAKPMKRALSVLLALVLSLSLVTPTWAAAKTPSSGTGNGLTWEKIDNRSTDLRLDKNNAEKVAQETPEYADTDVVRVSHRSERCLHAGEGLLQRGYRYQFCGHEVPPEAGDQAGEDG